MCKGWYKGVSLYIRELIRWEKFLFDGFFKGWHFFLFIAGIVLTLLILYSSHSFIFAHPDFIILVIVPPLLTWIKWSRLSTYIPYSERGAHTNRTDQFLARLSILWFTLKICVILMMIFRLMPTIFIAPYEFVSLTFWGQNIFILLLHVLMFSMMNLLGMFHDKPHLFFIFIYFPVAGLYFAIEQGLRAWVGWFNILLIIFCLISSVAWWRAGGET